MFDQFSCYLQVFCEQVYLNLNSAQYLMISNAPNNHCQPRGTPWRPSIYFIQFAAYKSPAIVDWTKPPTQLALVQTEELLHINLCFFQARQKRKHGEDIRESSYRYKVWCSIVQLILWSAEYPLLTTTIAWHQVNMCYFSILLSFHWIMMSPYEIPRLNIWILKNWKNNFFPRVPPSKIFWNFENCQFSMHLQNML